MFYECIKGSNSSFICKYLDFSCGTLGSSLLGIILEPLLLEVSLIFLSRIVQKVSCSVTSFLKTLHLSGAFW